MIGVVNVQDYGMLPTASAAKNTQAFFKCLAIGEANSIPVFIPPAPKGQAYKLYGNIQIKRDINVELFGMKDGDLQSSISLVWKLGDLFKYWIKKEPLSLFIAEYDEQSNGRFDVRGLSFDSRWKWCKYCAFNFRNF
jgi:hypothetical protein